MICTLIAIREYNIAFLLVGVLFWIALNRCIINKESLQHHCHFQAMPKSSHSKGSSSQVEVLDAIEEIMKPETLQLYTTWCKEKYAIESDELCVVRSQLKQLLLEDEVTSEPKPRDRDNILLAFLSKKQQKVSCMSL